jgi:hypothetical protein
LVTALLALSLAVVAFVARPARGEDIWARTVAAVKSFVAGRPGHPGVWTAAGWVAAFSDAHLPAVVGNMFLLAFIGVLISIGLAIFSDEDTLSEIVAEKCHG